VEIHLWLALSIILIGSFPVPILIIGLHVFLFPASVTVKAEAGWPVMSLVSLQGCVLVP